MLYEENKKFETAICKCILTLGRYNQMAAVSALNEVDKSRRYENICNCFNVDDVFPIFVKSGYGEFVIYVTEKDTYEAIQDSIRNRELSILADMVNREFPNADIFT